MDNKIFDNGVMVHTESSVKSPPAHSFKTLYINTYFIGLDLSALKKFIAQQ